MLKIAHLKEVQGLTLPAEVVAVIREAVTILDAEYGENREADYDLGGYVLVIEAVGELEQLQDFRIDIEANVPEYVDVIACSDGQVFTSSLILLNSDFSVVVIMPIKFLMSTGWTLKAGELVEKE